MHIVKVSQSEQELSPPWEFGYRQKALAQDYGRSAHTRQRPTPADVRSFLTTRTDRRAAPDGVDVRNFCPEALTPHRFSRPIPLD